MKAKQIIEDLEQMIIDKQLDREPAMSVEFAENIIDLIKRQKAEIERLLHKLQQAKSETIKLPHKVTAEVYSVLDREEFPKGVYKCEVSAYLIDGDDELYSLLTATVGDITIVGMKTDIENMYATREEAEAALREKESEEWEEK